MLSSLKGKEKDVSKNLLLGHHEDRRHRGAQKTESSTKQLLKMLLSMLLFMLV